MSARGLSLILAMLSLCAAVRACTEQDEDKQSYTTWTYAVPANGAQFSKIAYEVKRTGFHEAEIHFKNFDPHPIRFKFELPGFQNPIDRLAVEIAPSAPNDRQTIVPVGLKSGTTGAAWSGLILYDVQVGGVPLPTSLGSAVKLPGALFKTPPEDEAWFGLTTAQPYTEFGIESACCRIEQGPDGARALFRNTCREALYFDFVVLGRQDASTHNPRVGLKPGEERAVPIVLKPGALPAALARVRAFHICRDVEGAQYVDAADVEDGWFAVTAINCPLINPNQIVYHIEPAQNGDVAVRFRNISRSKVRFLFSLPGDSSQHEVRIAAEGETLVVKMHLAQANPTLARVKVYQVVYGDKPAEISRK